MGKNEDFEDIYETLVGERVPEAAVPGVESIASEGSAYSEAYQSVMEARMNLARRFGMDFEDEDLERIMNAIAVIEKETAKGMFRYAAAQFAFGGESQPETTQTGARKRNAESFDYYVIANQSADWCGNLLYRPLFCSAGTNIVPGDCHVGLWASSQ